LPAEFTFLQRILAALPPAVQAPVAGELRPGSELM